MNQPGGGVSFFILLMFTVAVYARPEDLIPAIGRFHLTLVLGICAGAAYVQALLRGRVTFWFSSELKVILFLSLWYLAGLPFALWKSGSLQMFLDIWLKTLFAFFLLTQTLTTGKRIRSLLWTIVLSESVVTAVTLLDRQNAAWQGDRLFGFNRGILGWNFLGTAMAMTVPYIAVLFLESRSRFRTWFLAATCGSLMWMLILTASRGGVLTVLLSIALTFLLVLSQSNRGRTTQVVVVVVLVLAVTLAPSVLWTRLGTLWGNTPAQESGLVMSAEESTLQRMVLLQRSLRFTMDHPLFGLGMGNFAVASGAEVGDASGWFVTHNTFTQISAEAGIPALGIFVWLLITAVRNLRRLSKALPVAHDLRLLSRATIVSIISFAFAGLFASMSYDYYLFYSIAIAVGLQTAGRKTLVAAPVAIETSTPLPPIQSWATQ